MTVYLLLQTRLKDMQFLANNTDSFPRKNFYDDDIFL